MEGEEERGTQRTDEVGEDDGEIKGAVKEKVKEEEGQEGKVKAEIKIKEKEETVELTEISTGEQVLEQNCAPLRPRPMQGGYCCPACGYKHQLETDVVEHLERCHSVHQEEPAHTGKKKDLVEVEGVEVEKEEEKRELGVESSAHESHGQPTLNATDSVSKYISYTSCRFNCRLCGYYAKTKSKALTGWGATGHKMALLRRYRIPYCFIQF